MNIINVLVLTVLTILSFAQGYIVPLCMEDGDVCGERLSLSLPGFSFYTQFCLTSPQEPETDSAVAQMFCTVCDVASRFTDMISSGIECAFENDPPAKPQTYFEILIEYLGLQDLIEKEQQKNCWEEMMTEHYSTAISSVLFLILFTLYIFHWVRKRKVVEPPDQLTFINKFEKGDAEESSKDDLSSVNELEDGI